MVRFPRMNNPAIMTAPRASKASIMLNTKVAVSNQVGAGGGFSSFAMYFRQSSPSGRSKFYFILVYCSLDWSFRYIPVASCMFQGIPKLQTSFQGGIESSTTVRSSR
jgi:hypothetical protein